MLTVTAGSGITPVAGMLHTLTRRRVSGPGPGSYSYTANLARTGFLFRPRGAAARPPRGPAGPDREITQRLLRG
ncbi:hypothetical protein ACFY1U_37720 [Streptomyces sp. NPDC001351]|uniref:hypothetical protein n=1 Tax=Streptomyces sp. NPDC001351 TaxID=3364564 RepID=UPI0036878053